MAEIPDPSPTQRLRRRVGLAAAISGLVAAAGAGALAVVAATNVTGCKAEEGWGCLGAFLLALIVVPVVAVPLLGLLLHLAGVRPAWAITPVGAVLTWFLHRAYLNVSGGELWLFAFVPAAAVAFTTATLMFTARASAAARAGPAAAVVALMLLSIPVSARQQSNRQIEELKGADVPLLGADLPGHRIEYPTFDQYAHKFWYFLTPRSAHKNQNTGDPDRARIYVTVAAAPPTFAPPRRCDAEGSFSDTRVAPCPEVAPGVWRWSRSDYVTYMARRGPHLAVVEARQGQVTDDELRQFTQTLTPRPPSFFVH